MIPPLRAPLWLRSFGFLKIASGIVLAVFESIVDILYRMTAASTLVQRKRLSVVESLLLTHLVNHLLFT